MFLLVGCGLGAGPYVSIMRRWAICFYWLAVGLGLGHMFLLVGCGRGAGPYVSIMRRWAICFYWLAVGLGLGHMFVLVGCGRGARPYVSIVRVYVYMCMYVCVYMCVCMCVCVCICMCVYICVCMCVCMCVCVCDHMFSEACPITVKELVGAIEVVQTSEYSIILGLNVYIHYFQFISVRCLGMVPHW